MSAWPTIAAPQGETRAISTAGGGTALSTTATCLVPLPGTSLIEIIPRNFATAVVAQILFNPWLTILKTTDTFAALANATDYSEGAQGNSNATAVTLSSLGATGAVWVGSMQQFGGLFVDVNLTNTASATIAATYWNGTTMATLSPTDGTASGGASFAIDGLVTWTQPSDWAATTLKTINATGANAVPYMNTPMMYWAKLAWNNALDSSVSLTSLLALNRSTAYAEYPSGISREVGWQRGFGFHGAIQAKVDAGSCSLILNCSSADGRVIV